MRYTTRLVYQPRAEQTPLAHPHYRPIDAMFRNMIVRLFRRSNSAQRVRWMLVAAVLSAVLLRQIWPARSLETAAPTVCVSRGALLYNGLPALPAARYLYNPTYGWFDVSHFQTGQPARLLDAVRAAVAAGGGEVQVEQDVRDGLTGYTAVYRISPLARPAEAEAIALGIYTHWSIRFEQWQAELPRGLFGPLTPFAIEDLPSQYVGFFAAARDLTVSQVFTCYLGQVYATEGPPPHFTLGATEPAPAEEEGLALNVLRNTELRPYVERAGRWEHRDWPPEMRLPLLGASLSTWHFVGEETWYFR